MKEEKIKKRIRIDSDSLHQTYSDFLNLSKQKNFDDDDNKESSKGLLSKVRLTELSSSPQLIVTQQVQAEKQTKRTQFTYIDKINLSDTTKVKKKLGIINLTSEKLPELPDKDSLLSWHHIRPENKLRTLLQFAKCRKKVNEFSRRDLELVVELCNYSGWFLLSNRNFYDKTTLGNHRKLTKLSIKILSYLAQHQRKLTESAIAALIKELSLFDKRTLSTAVLALSYSITNGQVLYNKEQFELLKEAIEKLGKLEDILLTIPVIVVGFAAKAKQEKKLSKEELFLLKRAIVYVGDNRHESFFPKTSRIMSYGEKSRRAAYRTFYYEIRNLRNVVHTGELLSKSDMKYVARRWYKINDDADKLRIMKTLVDLIHNKQRNFPEPEKTITALKDALEDNDRNIKNNAIIAVGYLTHSEGKEKEEYSMLRKPLNVALTHLRKYALQALNHHVNGFEKKDITDFKEWLEILEELKQDVDTEVSSLARFIIYCINNDLRTLENLLLIRSNSVEASIAFLQVARQKIAITDNALINLGKVIEKDYPFTARYNAVVILSEVAENSKPIPKTTIDAVIRCGLADTNLQIRSASLLTLGYYANIDVGLIANNNIINSIYKDFKNKSLCQNASFALESIIKVLPAISFEDLFTDVFNTAAAILNDNKFDSEARNGASSVLIQGVKKGYEIKQSVLKILESILCSDHDVPIKHIALNILRFIVEHNKDLILSEGLILELIKILSSKDNLTENNEDDGIIINNITYILSNYIKKTHEKLSNRIIINISKLLNQPSLVMIATDLLYSMVEKKWNIPLHVLENLSTMSTCEIDIVRIQATWIFDQVAECENLNQIIIFNLLKFFEDCNEEVVEQIISALRKTLGFNANQKIYLSQKNIYLLSQLIVHSHKDITIKINSAYILKYFSMQKHSLPVTALVTLVKALSSSDSELRKVVVDILYIQLENFNVQVSLKSKELNEIFLTLEHFVQDIYLFDDQFLGSTLATFRRGVFIGYQLSTPTIELLTKIVMIHKNIKIREIAFDILESIPSDNLPTKAKIVKELELSGKILQSNSQPSEKIRAKNVLLEEVKKGHYVTQNNLLVLEAILKNKDPILLKEVYYIIYLISQNRQELSNSLLSLLLECVKCETGIITEYCAHALAISIIFNERFVEGYSEIFENLILMEKINKLYLSVLELSVQNQEVLQIQTIKKLLGLATNKDFDERRLSAKIIWLLTKNQKDCFFIFEEILFILKNNINLDAEVAQYFILSLKNIFLDSSCNINNQSLEILTKFLQNCQDHSINRCILDLLSILNSSYSFSKEIDELIQIKNQEIIFLDKDIESDQRVLALQILIEKSIHFSEMIIENINNLLIHEETLLQKKILSILVKANDQLILPQSTILFVGDIYAKTPENKEAIAVLMKVVMAKQSLPIDTIKLLINIMLNSERQESREESFKILKMLSKYQKLDDSFEKIVLLEEEVRLSNHKNWSNRTIQRILYNIEKGLPLSINCFCTLKDLLKTESLTNENKYLYIKAIELFYASVDKISCQFYESLLDLMVELLTIDGADVNKISSIFTYILQSKYAFKIDYSKIFKRLQRSILSNGCKENHLFILEIILEKAFFKINEEMIVLIKNTLLYTYSIEMQEKLASILLYVIKQTETFSNITISAFQDLLFIIDRNVKNNLKNSEKDGLLYKTVNFFQSLFYYKNSSNNQSIIKFCKIERNILEIFAQAFRKKNNIFLDLSQLYGILRLYFLEKFSEQQNGLERIENLKIERKINVLFTLLTQDYLDLKILVSSEPWHICRELLCENLLMNIKKLAGEDPTFEDNRKRFYHYLKLLEESRGYEVYDEERDNVLDFIIYRQNKDKLNLNQINQLLIILRNSEKNPLKLLLKGWNEILSCWLDEVLSRFNSKTHYRTEIFNNIIELIKKLDFDVVLIDDFFIKIDNTIFLEEIYEYLDFLCKYKVSKEKIVELFEDFESFNSIKAFKLHLDHMREESQSNRSANFSGAYEVYDGVNYDFLHYCRIKIIHDVIKAKLNLIFLHINGLSEEQQRDIDINDSASKASLLLNCLLKLLEKQWNFDNMYSLLNALEIRANTYNYNQIENIYTMFDIAICYDISEEKFYEFDIASGSSDLVNELHRYAMSIHFSGEDNGKSIVNLLDELLKLNKNNKSVVELITSNKLLKILESSNEIYSRKIGFNELHSLHISSNEKAIFLETHSLEDFLTPLPIKRWTEHYIKTWAFNIKNEAHRESVLPEILAVLKRAYFLISGYEIRSTQLITVLLLLYTEKDKGRLAEVMTGEGKSIIIAMLGVIRALQGEYVDIVTSSIILANRDAIEFKKFYDLFDLKVADNQDDRYNGGKKKCYSQNIVYGDSNNFQFDLLRDEYNLLGTRGSREFSKSEVIIDEVDNLTIDQKSKIAMLSKPIPGMDHLYILLYCIWFELMRIDQAFSIQNGIRYYKEENATGEILSFEVNNHNQFITQKILDYLSIITNQDKEHHIKIPNHLTEFVEMQKLKWIKNALLAYYEFKNKHQYKIKPNDQGIMTPVPIDFANTGVTQTGTTWGDGLQQFLQIKHGLTITSENLVTNYISNTAYVNRYEHRISGLTGTLGSEREKELLSKMYKIDFVHIPTYKTKKFRELPGMIAETKAAWFSMIISSTLREAGNGRVSLIICETVKKAEKIFKRLKKGYGNVKLYAESDNDQGLFLQEIQEGGNVIIATNLAGRGTDIKVSQRVIEKGGLHVCFTFLPSNLRVEKQGFGRTSRRGEPGTAQLVLNKSDTEDKLKCIIDITTTNLLDLSIEQIKQLRDIREEIYLNLIDETEVPVIKKKDKLFNKFRALLKELRVNDALNQSIFKRLSALDIKISSTWHQFCGENIKASKISAVEEQWGIWLKKRDMTKDYSILKEKFLKFKRKILLEYENETVIKNPFYYIEQGNNLLIYANSIRGRIVHALSFLRLCEPIYQLAISAYDNAIELDKIYTFIAYYNRVAAILKLAKGDNREKAKFDLIFVKKIIDINIIPQLNSMSLLLLNQYQKDDKNQSQDLSQQITNKIEVLKKLIDSINYLIESLERSQRLIDIVYITDKKEIKFSKLNTDEAKMAINVNELELLTVNLHHLKTYKNNLWKSYQAKNTISKLDNNMRISIVFDSRNLNIPTGEDAKIVMKNLLPINRNKDIESASDTTETGTPYHNHSSNELTDPVGLYEHIGIVTSKLSSIKSTVVAKTTAAYVAVANPVTKKKRMVTDFIYRYYKGEKIPVTLITDHINFFQMEDLLSKIGSDDIKFDMIINNVDGVLLENVKLVKHFGKMCIYLPETMYQNEELNLTTSIFNKVKSLEEISPEILAVCKICFRSITVSQSHDISRVLRQPNKDIKSNFELSTVNLSLSFFNLSQKHAEQIIDIVPGDLTLRFDQLNKDDAEIIIELTESQNENATYQFSGLNKEEAEYLVTNADRQMQNFNVQLKDFESIFKNISDSQSELIEHKSNGFIYFFDINEKNPIPWASVVFVSALAVAKIAIGVSLGVATSGFAASVGFSLIAGGLCNLIKIFSIIQTREFNFSSFVVQETIDLAMTLAFSGIASAYQMSKCTARVGTTMVNAGEEVLERLGVKSIQSIGTLGQSAMINGLKTTGQKLMVTAIEMSVNETIDLVFDNASNATINQLKPSITKYVKQQMEIKLEKGTWSRILNTLYATDYCFGSDVLKQEIVEKAGSIITELNYNLGGYNVFDVRAFSLFDQRFSEVLRQYDREIPFVELLCHKMGWEQSRLEDAKVICSLLEKQKILSEGKINLAKLFKEDDDEYFTQEQWSYKYKVSFDIEHIDLNKLNLDKYENIKQDIIIACNSIDIIFSEDYVAEKKQLCQHVIDLFIDKINATLETVATITKEGVKLGANYTLGMVTEKIQNSSSSNDATGELIDGELHKNNGSTTIDNGKVTSRKVGIRGSNNIRMFSSIAADSANIVLQIGCGEIEARLEEIETDNIIKKYRKQVDVLIGKMEIISKEEQVRSDELISNQEKNQFNRIANEFEQLEQNMTDRLNKLEKLLRDISTEEIIEVTEILETLYQEIQTIEAGDVQFTNIGITQADSIQLSEFNYDKYKLERDAGKQSSTNSSLFKADRNAALKSISGMVNTYYQSKRNIAQIRKAGTLEKLTSEYRLAKAEFDLTQTKITEKLKRAKYQFDSKEQICKYKKVAILHKRVNEIKAQLIEELAKQKKIELLIYNQLQSKDSILHSQPEVEGEHVCNM